MDLVIAAQALDQRCILVSGDALYPALQQARRELVVENWTA
jgi:hypothetical protein